MEPEKSEKMPMLFLRVSNNKLTTWFGFAALNADGTALIAIRHGYIDGKKKVSHKIIKKGKNIGKKNETTPFEQAVLQLKSKCQKKMDKGYSIDPHNCEKPFLPMLAKEFTKSKKNIKYPALVQPKLNGVRCFATKVNDTEIDYKSRNGKSYNDTLQHLTPQLLTVMKTGETFDGEIYEHGWSFQRIISAVKKLREDSGLLKYWIYDMGNESMICKDRFVTLHERKVWKHENLILTWTETVQAEDEVYALHDKFVQDGFEGIMIRNMGSPYQPAKRTGDLQKYKEFFDGEFEIVGGCEGTGSAKGCVIFTVKNKDNNQFNVMPRGTVAHRQELFKNLDKLVGEMLTVRYQEMSEDGIPIFPVGISVEAHVRDYE